MKPDICRLEAARAGVCNFRRAPGVCRRPGRRCKMRWRPETRRHAARNLVALARHRRQGARTMRTVPFVLLAASFAGCSTVSVRATPAPGANLTQLHTFALMAPQRADSRAAEFV